MQMDAETTHVFYNPITNQYAEYTWSASITMFEYSIYIEEGPVQQGYMGLNRIKDAEVNQGWISLGSL